MRLSSEAELFRATDGSVLVYGNRYANPLYISPDGRKFHEMRQRSFSSSGDEQEIFFEDPHHNRLGGFTRKGDVVKYDGKTYEMDESVGEIHIDVVPLPNVRQPEYLFQMPDGQYIYVSADKYRYSYESFRLFIGKMREMKPIPITDVQRMRDGGTTYVETNLGILYSPTPFRVNEPATWELLATKQKIELTKLDPKKFTITEDANCAQCVA
jgi:hypothetical protein